MKLILFFFFIFLFSKIESKNATNRLYNPLVCYYETEGQLDGKPYHQEQHHEPCGPEVKYCQKITAHFFNAQGERTQILMKGCDTVAILPTFTGIYCHGNGCSERTYEDEIYTVCCCNTETCNSSQSQFNVSYFLIFSILMFIVF